MVNSWLQRNKPSVSEVSGANRGSWRLSAQRAAPFDPATTHHSFLSSFSAVSTATIARNGAFFTFFEIYKIFTLSHRSELKISKKFIIFFQNLANYFPKFCKFCWNFAKKSAKFVEILRSERCESMKIVEISKNVKKCAISRYRSCRYSRERAF